MLYLKQPVCSSILWKAIENKYQVYVVLAFHQYLLFPTLDVHTHIMPHTAVLPNTHTYSNSNTPPLTTHLALNVCEALRRQCP